MTSAADIRWFHSFDFGDEQVEGVTPLPYLREQAELLLGSHVGGKTVLDIGAWDGWYAFECERRGAADVLAVDSFCWSGPGWGSKAGFDYAHKKLFSRARSRDIDLFHLDPTAVGLFDVVLLLGVIYHLKDPFGGLEKAAAMTRDLLIVETASDMEDSPDPVMRFYLKRELNGDGGNFWAPNKACLEAMLLQLGFLRVEVQRKGEGRRGRLIAHAWKTR